MKVYKDIPDFFREHDETLFRYWRKDWDEGAECDYFFVIGIIPLSNGDFLLETQAFDCDKPDNRFPYKDYRKLSELTIAIAESDQEEVK